MESLSLLSFRHPVLLLVTPIVLLVPAARALDLNGDGMDDLWQERHGIGAFEGRFDPDGDGLINLAESISWSDPHNAASAWNLLFMSDFNPEDGLEDSWQAWYHVFPNASQPWTLLSADPDGDGRTNLEESIVGSDPFTADTPAGHRTQTVSSVPQGPDSFTLSLARTDPAIRYQLQSSEDLVTWTTQWWEEFDGDGSPRTITLDTTGLSKQFYRFILDQPDDDSDGLINWHEYIIGTNPSAADSDGDGLNDGWEIANGLDPLASDTDGDGAEDGAEVAASTNPNSAQSHPPVWRSIERTLRYDFDDYQRGRDGTLTTSGSWENSGGGAVALTNEIPWPTLAARLGTEVPFPQSKPASTDTQITSYSKADLIPNEPCYHATLRHRRVWLEVKPALSEAVTRQAVLLTVRTVDGQQATTATQTITATIPAGQTVSTASDLTPSFASNPSGNVAHAEEIEVGLVEVKATSQGVDYGAQPIRNQAGRYSQSPATGSVNNLIAVWPGEELKLSLRLPVSAQSAPLSTVWNAFGFAIPNGAKEYTFQWGQLDFGHKLVTIQVGGAIFTVVIDIPNVGSMTQLQASVLVGPYDAANIAAYSSTAVAYVDARFGLLPNYRKNAYRHAYWTAMCASDPTVSNADTVTVSTAHEYNNRFGWSALSNPTTSEPACESTLDLHNNSVGMTAVHTASGIPNFSAIQVDLDSKYQQGNLWIIGRPDGLPGGEDGIVLKSNGRKLY